MARVFSPFAFSIGIPIEKYKITCITSNFIIVDKCLWFLFKSWMCCKFRKVTAFENEWIYFITSFFEHSFNRVRQLVELDVGNIMEMNRGKPLLDCVQTPMFTFPPCYWLLLLLSVCVCICVCLLSYQIQLVLSEAKGSGWGRVSDGQIAQCKRLADNSLICCFMCQRLDLFTIFPVSNRPLPICLQRPH